MCVTADVVDVYIHVSVLIKHYAEVATRLTASYTCVLCIMNSVVEYCICACCFQLGYRATRLYWSFRCLNKRCKFVCKIAENENKPELSLTY